MKKMKWINLMNNEIKDISKDIKRLKCLSGLILSNNQLTSLPSSIRHLEQLAHLDISNNSIIKFPKWIKRLEKLKVFTYFNCGSLPRKKDFMLFSCRDHVIKEFLAKYAYVNN
jgi:hypothetical protein